MVEAGVDIVEVGLPYSDPLMDGPVIQRAAEGALAAGTRVDDVFLACRALADLGTPALVMTYWNPVLRRGVDAFARDLAASGAAGLITPDLIPDEAADWIAASDAYGLDRVFLVAPSSTRERLVNATAASRGFVYAASLMGVTGTRESVGSAAESLVARTREVTDLPVCVGHRGVQRRPGRRGGRVRRRGHRRVRSGPDARRGHHARRGHRPASRPRRRPRRRGPAQPREGHDVMMLTALPLEIPSPTTGVWNLGPLPDPRLRHVHPRGHRRRDLDHASADWPPAAAHRGRSSTSRRGRCRSASSAAGSTTSSPRRRPTSARAATRGTRSRCGRAASASGGPSPSAPSAPTSAAAAPA